MVTGASSVATGKALVCGLSGSMTYLDAVWGGTYADCHQPCGHVTPCTAPRTVRES